MAIELISKIKPKNNGNFKLVDVQDVEYNGKGLDEAIASGEFKGDKGDRGDIGPMGPTGPTGPKGDNGNDGFSPTVSVAEDVDGVTVTVQNKDGAQTAKVKNGKNYEHSEEFSALAEQVRADKESVEQSKTSVEQTVAQAEGKIDTAGTIAIQGVQNEGTTQTEKVTVEGTKQITEIQSKGEEILHSFPQDFPTQMATKLDKQQGTEHAGKALVIGEDGLVVPGKVQSDGGDGIAIVNTVSGVSPLVIADSADRIIKDLKLFGKTEQVQTTGAQLFDASGLDGVTKSGITVSVKDGIITATGTTETDIWIQLYVTAEEYKKLFKPGEKIYIKTQKSSDCNYDFGIYGSFGSPILGTVREGNSGAALPTELPATDTSFYFFMDIKKGSALKGSIKPIVYHNGNGTWEPYTGGKPSPSPECPQEIKSVGKWNESTQKYEIGFEISSNFFDITKVRDTRKLKNNKDGSLTITNSTVEGLATLKEICPDLKVDESYVMRLESTGLSYVSCGEIVWDTGITKKVTQPMLDSALYFYGNVNNTVIIKDIRITRYTGKVMEYTPYRKPQTLTLTSDRPLTHWDKLVEQDGQIGWLYKSKTATITGKEHYNAPSESYYSGTSTNMYTVDFGLFIKGGEYCNRLQRIDGIWDSSNTNNIGFTTNASDQIHIRIYNSLLNVSDNATKEEKVAAFKTYLTKEYENGNPYIVIFQTKDTEFVPLPQSEQNAIRALTTHYPTTVITVDGGELDPDIEVTYTADTKTILTINLHSYKSHS